MLQPFADRLWLVTDLLSSCACSRRQVLMSFSSALHAVNPCSVPGFAFAWLELVSHRTLMPNLLLAKQNKGWAMMHRLLVDLFVFMEPHLRRYLALCLQGLVAFASVHQ